MFSTHQKRFHYGLEFAMTSSPGDVEKVIKALAKKNRGIQVTKQDRKMLKSDLKKKMQIRERKEADRRRRYYK